jgi:hypothetical protein
MKNGFEMFLFDCQDFIILPLSNLYRKAMFDGFFDLEHGSYDGIIPYILGDKGYPLLPWFMIPHK